MWSKLHYCRCLPGTSDVQEPFCRPVFLNSMIGSKKECNKYSHMQCLHEFGLFTVFDLLAVDLSLIQNNHVCANSNRDRISCLTVQATRKMISAIPLSP